MNHFMHQFRYSEKDRRINQNPEEILLNIGLKEGMYFIDSGCNDGYFTLPASRIVGNNGKVWAIDIDSDALNKLKEKLKKESINNTEIIASPAEEVIIATNIADIIFFSMVLHDFKNPSKVLKNSKQMLKEDGIIYDYDWQKSNTLIGPPIDIRLSQKQVKDLAEKNGLAVKYSKIIDKNFYAITLVK